MKNLNNLPLRLGVGIILLNDKNKILVGKRIDNHKNNCWQMPQGGINKNEEFVHAAKRELEEETSVKSVKVIKQFDDWLTYELPKHLLGKIWRGKYRGQKQKWFIVRFTGNDSEINLYTKNPEFIEWKWIDCNELPNVIVDFKKHIYEKLLIELNKINH